MGSSAIITRSFILDHIYSDQLNKYQSTIPLPSYHHCVTGQASPASIRLLLHPPPCLHQPHAPEPALTHINASSIHPGRKKKETSLSHTYNTGTHPGHAH